MISFWGGLFFFLFYLVLVLWVRKEETKIMPYNRKVLRGKTEKVTVSPLPAALLLYVRDGFLQLCHGDREVATPSCPCTWAGESQSQSLAPPHPRGKQRTKRGAVVLPEPLPCPAVGAIPAARGKCHFPKQESVTFATSKLNKWFPGPQSNPSLLLAFTFQFRNYERDSPALS